ncbi:MAG: ROK family transcriptional regulator [Lachnospiraceae bacterium]|nr:ROK family transcriptional regulator [Lachnospiraceae bacterium]
MITKGMTTFGVKEINRKAIYQYIYKQKQASKQELTLNLQMSLTTVTQNLKELEEQELIKKAGHLASTGGRKPIFFVINNTKKIAIGISIFQKTVLMTAIDLYGNPLCRESVTLSFENTDAYCKEIGHALNTFIKMHALSEEKILGVGIAIQGIVSEDGSHVHYGTLMKNTNFQLSQLEKYIPYPCHLIHDSKAAAYTELWNNDMLEDTLVVLLNTNLGSAFILNGQIHGGLHMHSGTIEHICIDPNGHKCYCGHNGCLETLCSAGSLAREAGCDIEQFFTALRDGNTAYREIWNIWLDRLAFALNNINTIIDCHITLSGYLAAYINDDDINLLFQKMQGMSAFTFTENFITCKRDGKYSTATGAGLYFIHQFLEAL